MNCSPGNMHLVCWRVNGKNIPRHGFVVGVIEMPTHESVKTFQLFLKVSFLLQFIYFNDQVLFCNISVLHNSTGHRNAASDESGRAGWRERERRASPFGSCQIFLAFALVRKSHDTVKIHTDYQSINLWRQWGGGGAVRDCPTVETPHWFSLSGYN